MLLRCYSPKQKLLVDMCTTLPVYAKTNKVCSQL